MNKEDKGRMQLFVLMLMSTILLMAGEYYLMNSVIDDRNETIEQEFTLIDSLLYEIYVKDTIIYAASSSVIRTEIIFGVDSPDGLISLREKWLIGGRNTLGYIDHKFECEK